MDIGGLVSKFEKNAELIVVIGSGYAHEREFGGGLGGLFGYLTGDLTGKRKGPLAEIQKDIEDPDFFFYKLLESGHLYSTLFKIGVGGYIAGEMGFLTKYKKLSEKLAKGGFIAAAVLQGSGSEAIGSRGNRTLSNKGYWSNGQ
jgi:hypothetical protein